MTLIEVLRLATGHIEKTGSPSARLDAEVMLADVLGMDRLGLYLDFDRPLSETEVSEFRDRVRRRGHGEPVAYIVGRKEFMGHQFTVTSDTLIPRPETESLVEMVLEWAGERPGLECADVGTGCGAIAITLALHLPGARVVATDISSGALEVARRNVERHEVQGRVELRQGNLLEPITETVDLMVANLPYVTDGALDRLPVSVRDFEPHQALFGGPDGLNLLVPFLGAAPGRLRPGGAIFCELDEETAPGALAAARENFPGARVEALPDLAGQERMLTVIT
ncbi:MAG: peptide chain release factor N(5)-glutamine methyltransferase [Candidatus Dormibacteria bacterium]